MSVSVTQGLSAPTGLRYTILGCEILATGGVPPTRVGFAQPSGWASTAATLTTSTSLTLSVGDTLVVLISAESDSTFNTTQTNPSVSVGAVTWTMQNNYHPGGTGGNQPAQVLFTGTVTTGGTATVTASRPLSATILHWGFTVSQWSGAGGIGSVFANNDGTGTGAPSATATCSDHSAVVCQINDWNASATTGTTWLNINGSAETSSFTPVQDTNYSIWGGYSPDVGGAATAATPTQMARLVNPRRRPARVGRLMPHVQGAAPTTVQNSSSLTASIGFAGSYNTATSKHASASVGFTGAKAVAVVTALVAASLGFTGALARKTFRAFTAALSFTGSVSSLAVHHFTQALTAALSFTGAENLSTSKKQTASVSFTGSQSRAVGKAMSASVSFTTAQARRIAHMFTAGLSFTAGLALKTSRAFTAGVSFAGTFSTKAVHFFTQSFTATVGFTGSVATAAVHHFSQAFTASVGFTGAMTKGTVRAVTATVGLTAGQLRCSIGSGQSATLGFAGGIGRRVGKRITAALAWVGSLVGFNPGASHDVTILSVVEHQRGVTVVERQRSVTVVERQRGVTITGKQRQVGVTDVQRVVSIEEQP